MTRQPTISNEAREAAQEIVKKGASWFPSQSESEQIIQLAISAATEKLEKENIEAADKVAQLQTTILGLREALQFIQSQIGIGQLNHALTRILDSATEALSKSAANFRKDWCRRSVLEKCNKAISSLLNKDCLSIAGDYLFQRNSRMEDELKDALAAARKELEEK